MLKRQHELTVFHQNLHYAKSVVTKPITNLVNLSLSKSIFPDTLKIAQVAPVHKKGSLKR
jgi:hypothetical protein